MSTPNPYDSIVRFSVYELNFSGRVLRKAGMRVHCQEQPLQVLAALLEKPGVLVTRKELRGRVWPEDTFVDFDHALNTAVKKLRNVLSDDADAPRYIETVPRRGYRFIGPIQPAPQAVLDSKPLTSPPGSAISGASVILVATLVLVFSSVTIYYFTSRHATVSENPSVSRPAMLAVLPFQNMTSDPGQETFSDGMTEETITRLARLNSPRFHVIARTSAMKYKHVAKSVDEIARELHADYLLEGSIRREGPHVRISCQLIRAADQSPRWSQEYDFESGDPLTLETRGAETIAVQLNAVLGDSSVPHHSIDDHAFDSYLRGLAESGIHTPEGLDRTIATFEKAVVDDPNCPQPLASLARIYERGANLGFLPPRAAYAKARAAAERAILLDPSLPESHVYLADAMLTIDYDWQGAQAEIQRALDLNANDPMSHEWNGIFLAIQNKPEAALEEMRRAVELDPLNADRKICLSGLLDRTGRLKEAEEQLKAALQLDPASVLAHSGLLHLYTSWGRQDEAITEWSTVFFLNGQPESANSLKSVYHKSGFDAAKRFAMKKELVYLTRIREHRYVSPFSFAVLYARIGENDQAISWLQKAYQLRDVNLPCLANFEDSTFASIKNDPRVKAIVDKIRPPQ
ncbi:MAG: winged helix-turn-helix domain-containing protein [Candidatus Acidiferrum sp.]|jgi:TolB-like protein/DNA-binding winged helix-turn-helix (wHTH) protein/Tfp pilus assembly protein PilF